MNYVRSKFFAADSTQCVFKQLTAPQSIKSNREHTAWHDLV